jgi:sugar/nucleoside kinase (ribokinase family)
MRQTLDERGVDLTYALEREGANRDAVILIEPDGRRTVLWQRPDNVNLPAGYLRPEYLDARLMHVDDDDPDLALAAARLGRAAALTITTDLEHVNDRIEELIATVTCPIFEQNAPQTLTGESDPERALRKLRRLTPQVLYMTLGDRGAVALDGDHFHAAPAFRVNVLDNTGAGDVFRAGLIYGLLQGWKIARRLAFANAAAAVSCTRLGAIPSVPDLEEVSALLDRGPEAFSR